MHMFPPMLLYAYRENTGLFLIHHPKNSRSCKAYYSPSCFYLANFVCFKKLSRKITLLTPLPIPNKQRNAHKYAVEYVYAILLYFSGFQRASTVRPRIRRELMPSQAQSNPDSSPTFPKESN